MDSKILVLTDYRLGNSNQALALAKELVVPYTAKHINYNCFAKLPNFLLQFYPLHIKHDCLQSIEINNLPNIIISSGRRTAALALYLKRKSIKKLQIVQIMKPDSNFNEFDMVILPQHDSFTQTSSNVIRIIGALSDIHRSIKDQANIENIRKIYPETLNCIAVIIGGNSKNYIFTVAEAKLLVSILKNIVIHHTSQLFITFSRRTPQVVKQVIRQHFSNPHIIYDPQDSGPNPYLALLASANYIISTADSISMCSEAASTAKPLYIFLPDSFKLSKHRFFVQQLFDLGIAKKLDQSVNVLQHYSYTPLNETKRVAEIIKSELTC
ncbi:Elm1 superfamily protein [Candidatus Trichorickettsia mobilis]|uniref:Elm1 superfamily protein n=1 Tax=Candidatus Trichorickettsia mobilis TaxID=1346319 RepID=A0ABZ0USG7_9RICK|nr:ELM1/GtrOC1 family putative glycosyltransferase [Candidatus Trichorickettsia mobilis]WPY00962.1 Elm1 superfamily protein [Candidatus Trichorickettsia mobilis]